MYDSVEMFARETNLYGCFVGSMMKLFGSLGQPSRKIDYYGRRQHLHDTFVEATQKVRSEVETSRY